MIRNCLLMIFLALSLNACAPTYVIWNKSDFPPSKINASISSLEIVDYRRNIQKIEFNKNEWFGKFSFDKELSKNDRDLIREEIARNFVNSETDLRFTVHINKAKVEFENTGLKERWRGHFQIKMIISGPSGKSYCNGDASITRTGGLFLKVKPVLEKLFEEGIILTSYKCIEAWKNEVKLAPQHKTRI